MNAEPQAGTKPREPLRLRLEGVAWLAGWRLTRMLPERVAVAMFERAAERSWRTNERRRSVVRDNLSAVVPADRLDDTVRAAFRSYARYWAETFRMQDVSSEELNRRFRIRGQEHVDAAYARGKGIVLATLHLGNWDAAGRWAAERWPVSTVVEVLRPRILFERFVAHRRSLGMTIIPLARDADPTGQCLERLAAGDLLALVADRDLSGGGVDVVMFGRPTKLPPGPAVLSLRSGAPLIPAAIYMSPGGFWDAEVLPPIDTGLDRAAPEEVRDVTQRLAAAFEHFIGAAPEQWHAFLRYWLP